MPRVTDHTHTEKIGGDSIVCLWSSKSWRETVMTRDLLQKLNNAKIFSKFDMKSGFWQIQIQTHNYQMEKGSFPITIIYRVCYKALCSAAIPPKNSFYKFIKTLYNIKKRYLRKHSKNNSFF